jgi:hypothetical protein
MILKRYSATLFLGVALFGVVAAEAQRDLNRFSSKRENQNSQVPLGAEQLHFWSPQSKTRVVQPSDFDVWAGGDSTASLHGEFNTTQ